MNGQSRDSHAHRLNRREFLIAALLASGAVVMGPHGLLMAAGQPALDVWPAYWPTRDRPLVEAVPERTVRMYAELSLAHLTRTTAHWGIGSRGGTLADKFILLSPATPEAFHASLLRIGARPGNNLRMYSYGACVAGDALTVSALWPGLSEPLDLEDIFHDSAGKGFHIRFGGNKAAAREYRTGCLTCLESCLIGITSNTAYPHISPLRRTLLPNSTFRGRPEILPHQDAFPLVVSYQLAGAKLQTR